MDELDLKEVFSIFWNKKLQIIIIVLVFLVAGFIYSAEFVKPMYSSSTTVVLVSSGSNANTNTMTTTDVTMNSKLVTTYSKIIKSDAVLSKVEQNLGEKISLEQLKNNVSAKEVTDTELIEISAKNEDPYIATQIANEVTKVFTEQVQELYNINNVQQVSEAQVPSSPYNVNNTKNIALFGLIGLAVAIAYVLALNAFDTTIKSAEEIEKDLGLPVLASIPKLGKKGGKK